jgi:hypothetical protein
MVILNAKISKSKFLQLILLAYVHNILEPMQRWPLLESNLKPIEPRKRTSLAFIEQRVKYESIKGTVWKTPHHLAQVERHAVPKDFYLTEFSCNFNER